MVLETGIFMSQAIWLWRVRHVRREAKKAGKTYDDYIAENPSIKIPRSESSETVVDLEACHGTQAVHKKADSLSGVPSQSKDLAAEPPTFTKTLIAKWRNLVLRPVPKSGA